MSGRRYRERIYAAYRDSLAPELEVAAPIDERAQFAHFDRHYAPLLPERRDAALLDLGCGLGYFLSYLKARGYTSASGVDASPQMAEAARARGLSVELGDMKEALKKRAGTLDVVCATDVLEHCDKDELIELLDLANAALKPGGTFLCHTVNADGLIWGRMRYIDLTHELAFTRYSLSQLFTVTGFKDPVFRAVTPAGAGLLARFVHAGARLAAGLLHHAESGSGVWNNDHIVTSSILAKAVRR